MQKGSKMRKIFVKYYTGYIGQEGTDVLEFDEADTDEMISEDCYCAAIDHAAAYGIEMCSDDCDDEDCEMEHPGNSGIEAGWEDYVPEKHDPYLY
jgi:hypothetical protein